MVLQNPISMITSSWICQTSQCQQGVVALSQSDQSYIVTQSLAMRRGVQVPQHYTFLLVQSKSGLPVYSQIIPVQHTKCTDYYCTLQLQGYFCQSMITLHYTFFDYKQSVYENVYTTLGQKDKRTQVFVYYVQNNHPWCSISHSLVMAEYIHLRLAISLDCRQYNEYKALAVV